MARWPVSTFLLKWRIEISYDVYPPPSPGGIKITLHEPLTLTLRVTMQPNRRLLVLPLLLACTATTARAQDLMFQNIPWGTPADSVSARIEALGYTYRGLQDAGDCTFDRADGTNVIATMRAGRLVGIAVNHPNQGAAMEARYRMLADSLQAVLGPPVDWRPNSRTWERGRTSVAALIDYDPETGAQSMQTQWNGPEWLDEATERGEYPRYSKLPPPYTTVRIGRNSRVSVDTASLQRRSGGVFRARFRIEYRSERGEGGEHFDAIEYQMDSDCTGARARLVSRTTFLARQRQHAESDEGLPWSPVRAGDELATGVDAICRVGGQVPAAAVQPLRRVFAPVPPGWVVVSDRTNERWLLNKAAIRAIGAGVYGTTVRTEYGVTESRPWGRTDGNRYEWEVDCSAGRQRFTAGALQFAGQDVQVIPVPPERAVWRPSAASNPVRAEVCRIARERGL